MGTPTPPAKKNLAAWEDLAAFVVIADGVRQGMTVQAVGAQHDLHGFGDARLLYLRLARIERAFDTRLVQRRKWSRETQLTPAGEWLASQLTPLVELRRNLHAHFDALGKVPLLRLFSSRTILTTLLPHFLHRWHAEKGHDRLRLQIQTARQLTGPESADLLRRCKIDAAVELPSVERRPPPDLREIVVRRDVRTVVLCPRVHPFAERSRRGAPTPVNTAELAEETIIGPLPDALERLLPPPQRMGVRVATPSYEFSRAYVRMELGIAFSFDLVEALRPSERDVVVLPLEPPALRKLVVRVPKVLPVHPNPVVREFLDAFVEHARMITLSPLDTPARVR